MNADIIYNRTMTNKKIQEERIKNYFIQATKKILKGEGLKAVNVRNISREAGYSYATLYNYFKDVKDLIFECVQDFQAECEEQIKTDIKGSQHGIIRIKKIVSSFMKYFVQYPGIFELFYIEKTSDLGQKHPTTNMIYTFLDKLCEEEWNYCIENNICSPQDSEIKKETLRNLIVGILLFYLHRYNPKNYNDFLKLSERQINNILS
jgi:AcrR family transcriptional regulator